MRSWWAACGRRRLRGRGGGRVHALNGVSLVLARGETIGIVGESGCGKSTLARTVLRLIEPSGGRVRFAGEDLGALSRRALRRRRRDMQIVFQDPYAALDPRARIGATLEEPLIIHRQGDRARAARAGARAAGAGRPARGRACPLSARVLGRPAPADRHRPRARGRPQASGARRAGLGARRVDPVADPQSAGRAAVAPRLVLPLHQP